MHNTLDKFYNYLAEILFRYFITTNPLQPGDRYFVHFENEDDVTLCFRQLVDYQSALAEDFSYRYDEDTQLYQTKTIQFGHIKLILASHKDATENFLTMLRNQVALQEGPFENTAILILFSGQLDSLIGGSGDLTKSGMPLSFDSFNADIQEKISHNFATKTDKRTILELALKNKINEFPLGELSIFDFNHIIAIVQNQRFEKEDFQLLGLFPHQELETIMDVNRIREKLDQNHGVFETIEYAVNYGNVQSDLDRLLTTTGITEIERGLADESWKLIDYADLVRMIIKPDKEKPVDYKGAEQNLLSANLAVWERKDSNNRRLFHVIIFNSARTYPFTQNFEFSATLRGTLNPTKVNRSLANVERIGKQLQLTVNSPAYNSDTLFFEYADQKVPSAKFRFRVWVIDGTADFLEEFKANYSVSLEGQLVLDTENTVRLNTAFQEKDEFELVPESPYTINEERALILQIRNDDEEVFPFRLIKDSQDLDVLVKQQIGASKPAKGWDIWQNKRIGRKSYQHVYIPETDTLKLVFGNEEFGARDEFRQNILLEIQMMADPSPAWFQSETGLLTGRTLRLSKRLTDAYQKYVDHINSGGYLPSLFYHTEEACQIARDYIQAFLVEVGEIGDNQILSEEAKADLLMIGTVTETDKDQIVKVSPLHPLMVAYQLEIYSQVKDNKLYEAMLRKLTPLNLLPYIFWNNGHGSQNRQLYASKENSHSPEWLYYSNDLHFKRFAGRDFIRGLVSEKIHEFVTNFSFLFAYDLRAPIKINVFNMGDCLQVLQGIFDYYKERVLGGVAMHDLRPIELFLHGSDHYVTTFERMSHLIEQEDIERSFDLMTNTKRIDFEDLINAFRSKVHYYAIEPNLSNQYAHLTFYQFDNQHTSITYRDHAQIPSGLSMNGLLSDLPSYYHDLTYVTGFGTNYILGDNELIQTAKAYNSLAKVSFSKDPFEEEKVICTTINNGIKANLNQLYDHSQWVVFVDPHFDLSFFKDETDLIIIHYSDQYSNASGFDAITVSRKSTQYRHLLETILTAQGVNYSNIDIFQLINLYNAINGQWLIKMIGKKDEKTRKEKISIPAAMKLFLAYYDHPEVTWVPVSLEEILRISGGAGLSKSEGLFSTANLGAKNEHSDDLLMIGLYEKDGRLHIQFYPVEVKIGINNSTVLDKARNQALKTYNLIYEHLTSDVRSFEAAFYRSFFAKLAIMNASKMELYEVWPEKNWAKVTGDYRSRLLNDDFIITTELSSVINKYAVIAFTQSALIRSYQPEDEGILVTHFEEDAYQYLVQSIPQLNSWLFDMPNSIKKEELFIKKTPALSDLPVEIENVVPLTDVPLLEVLSIPEILVAEPIAEEEAETSEKVPIRIYFGNDINNGQPIYWFPTDTTQVMHSNTGIIGTMGTGKTQFTKSLVTQLHRESKNNVGGKPIGILIFDYKGDYINDAFVNATGAKVYTLYDLPYNPLSVDVTPRSVPLLPLHIASTLQETISLAFNLGNKQKALLKEMIMLAYEDKGIIKNQKETWSRPAPTIADVYEKYLEDERMTTDSLHAALNQLYEYQIFQPEGSKTKSLYELIDGVTVINLSGYSGDIQNLVVAITLDAFYSQMQKNGHSQIDQNFRQLTKMILVDEADNFLSKNFMSIRKILKEGREFGVGTLLSTQFLNHFSTGDNEYAQYILTWIVHRVNDIKIKDVEALFPVFDKDQKDQLLQMIKKLEKHHSAVNLAGSKPIFIEDYPFWKLIN
ncbi:DUF87 domain-containing protein [Mucilaginibacter sp. 14171R-50]|uniref:helicase HerA domain-containing protein n=1 Tax=Mucilaginibacter sp. 14171R-50 TaxID=2703789 RepID=UPI00138B5B05|nr:DUF87 domain-containing protein [Mucilaginibacter sp. 14171R-50]QHS55933.1 DUF87 domain-containing protein [Mucilaginibacter sp. 14171R-50]